MIRIVYMVPTENIGVGMCTHSKTALEKANFGGFVPNFFGFDLFTAEKNDSLPISKYSFVSWQADSLPCLISYPPESFKPDGLNYLLSALYMSVDVTVFTTVVRPRNGRTVLKALWLSLQVFHPRNGSAVLKAL